jgi:hypothetical protein
MVPLWLKTVGYLLLSLVPAALIGALLAAMWGVSDPISVLFFTRSLIVASLGYVYIAVFSPSRADSDALAWAYTKVWPIVGSLAVSAAHLLNTGTPEVTELEHTNSGIALVSALLMAGHPLLSLYLSHLLNSRNAPISTTQQAPSGGSVSATFVEAEAADLAMTRKFDLLKKHSPAVQKAYDRVQRLPTNYHSSFIQNVTSSPDPARDANTIADELVADLERQKKPFADPKANDYHERLWTNYGEGAAREFRDALAALGDSADHTFIFKKIAATNELSKRTLIGEFLAALCWVFLLLFVVLPVVFYLVDGLVNLLK